MNIAVVTVDCVFVNVDKDDGLGTLFTGDPDFSSTPKLVASASTDFQRRENFLRGCLWSVHSCLILVLRLTYLAVQGGPKTDHF